MRLVGLHRLRRVPDKGTRTQTRQLCDGTHRKHRGLRTRPPRQTRVSSRVVRSLAGMSSIAVIHIPCEANPSLGTSVVNGPLAWAGVLGGCTVFFSGLPAAVAVFIPGRPEALSRRINRWLGIGFLAGMFVGLLVFFAFVARIVS